MVMSKAPADTRVPTHWNIHNEIDGWSGKTFGLWWGLALNAIMFLALWLLPWYSPWYRKYEERFDAVLPPLTTTLVFFFALISVYALAVAKWGDIGQVNMILIFSALFSGSGWVLWNSGVRLGPEACFRTSMTSIR